MLHHINFRLHPINSFPKGKTHKNQRQTQSPRWFLLYILQFYRFEEPTIFL
jgi:hypothetical protein